MRQRESGRTQPHHQHFVPAGRERQRTREIQRIPARQQAVDFEAPRQLQHVLQRTRFHLRNVHRVLLLENAGLHAVVADAMPGAGRHRVVDGDNRQRAQGVALLLHHVHLGDLFIQRAARQSDAEQGLLELAGFFLQSGGAAVFALVVALDAVVGLIERACQPHARIGQMESFAAAPAFFGQAKLGDPVLRQSLHRDQMQGIQLVRHLEQNIAVVLLSSRFRQRGPGRIACGDLDLFQVLRLFFQPRRDVRKKALLGERLAENRFQFAAQARAIDGFRLLLGDAANSPLLNELALESEERRQTRCGATAAPLLPCAIPNSSPRKSSTCGASAITSSDCSLAVLAPGLTRASSSWTCRPRSDAKS